MPFLSFLADLRCLTVRDNLLVVVPSSACVLIPSCGLIIFMRSLFTKNVLWFVRFRDEFLSNGDCLLSSIWLVFDLLASHAHSYVFPSVCFAARSIFARSK